jgi:ACS family tartrate transporter-like MFS transporter
VLAWSGLIYACGIIGVYLSGQSSDRTGDRKWHCVAGQTAAALFLAGSTIPGQPMWLVIIWLCFTGFFANFWPPPFWALPTLTLTASAAAVSIGFINMSANLAGYFGNHNVGWLKAHGFADRACLLFLASCYLLGGAFVACLRLRTHSHR